jgi:anti-anti-sigma regulatory factor
LTSGLLLVGRTPLLDGAEVTVRLREGVHVATLTVEPDETEFDSVLLFLHDLLGRRRPVLVDLSAVDGSDEAFIRLLLIIGRRAALAGTRLALVPSRGLLAKLGVLGLDGVFDVYTDPAKALDRLSAAARPDPNRAGAGGEHAPAKGVRRSKKRDVPEP